MESTSVRPAWDAVSDSRMDPCTFRQRSSRRGTSMRSVHTAKASMGPRQRNVSTLRKSRASVLRVASLEQQRLPALIAEHVRRKSFDRPVPIEHPRRRDRRYPRSPDTRRPHRLPAPDSRRSTPARHRISRTRHRRRASCWRGDPFERPGRPSRIVRVPCRRSRSRPCPLGAISTKCAPRTPVRHPPPTRPWARPPRPWRRAGLRAAGIAPTVHARCLRRSCSRARVVAKRRDDVIGGHADMRGAFGLSHDLPNGDRIERLTQLGESMACHKEYGSRFPDATLDQYCSQAHRAQ
jgi:hypothetical protein